ncbi:MAG: hypothetical protein ACKO2L_14455 [Planctomycetaceae bacterium]
MPTPFERPITEPPALHWKPEIWRPKSPKLSSLRSSARRSFQQASAQFLRALAQIAELSDLQLPLPPTANPNPDSTPLLLTGHQPVIFHPGLVFKYQLTQAVAASHHCTAAALVIDTDEGDPGVFEVPRPATLNSSLTRLAPPAQLPVPALRRTLSTFSAGPGLYAACRLAPRSRRSEVTADVLQALRSAECLAAATAFSETAAHYARLPDDLPMTAANTLIRRAAGIGSGMAEVPLTTVCGLPEVLRFFSDLLATAPAFHQTYNTVLTDWRQQQGIRNDANPFPNLRSAPNALELPFWLVDPRKGTRAVAWLHTPASPSSHSPSIGNEYQTVAELPHGFEAETLLSLQLAGQLLVPRGALITATLRLLFSDLFIHGLGGGHYDPATDELIRRWWQESPPPFAVASASMCLFPVERTAVRQLLEFRSHYRDLQFNPGRYLDQPVFSGAHAAEIRGLLEQKQKAVEELAQHRATGTSGRETGRRLQQLSDAIRTQVTRILQPHREAIDNLSEETVSTVESRTWPWFFFPGDWDLTTRGCVIATSPKFA